MEGPSPFQRLGTERLGRTGSLGEIRLDRNPLVVLIESLKNTIHRREKAGNRFKTMNLLILFLLPGL